MLNKKNFIERHAKTVFAASDSTAFFLRKMGNGSIWSNLSTCALKMIYCCHDAFLRGVFIKPQIFHNLRSPVLQLKGLCFQRLKIVSIKGRPLLLSSLLGKQIPCFFGRIVSVPI